MARFRRAFRRLAPRWLTSGDGELVLYSLGLVMDAMAERVLQGVRARLPERAPADAMSAIGRDRRFIRGQAEPASVFATRTLRWLDDWRTAGNPFAVLRQLAGYLFPAERESRTVDNRGNWYTRGEDGSQSYLLDQGNWDWDGEPTKWSRFWVILYSLSGSPFEPEDTWGSGTWGDGGTWGTSATPDQVRDIRRIVREWKPAGTRCVNVIVAVDEANAFAPGTSLDHPAGDWTHWSKVVGSTRRPARNAEGRYFDGT